MGLELGLDAFSYGGNFSFSHIFINVAFTYVRFLKSSFFLWQQATMKGILPYGKQIGFRFSHDHK